MSTSIDARHRPSLWSYISFSTPRRRSVSLPTRTDPRDPFEKADRHKSNGSANLSIPTVDHINGAWMTQSQRSRYLKAGGIVALFVFLFFWLSRNEGANVRELVSGMSKCLKFTSDCMLIAVFPQDILAQELRPQIRRQGQRSARSLIPRTSH